MSGYLVSVLLNTQKKSQSAIHGNEEFHSAVSLLSVNINCENRNIKGMTWISHLLSIFSVMFCPTWGLEGSGDLSSPDKTSPVVSRLPPFLLGLFHYSGVNLYANGSASCPLSAGARVGFPHSCRLTPPTPHPPRSLYRSSVSFPPSTPVYHLEWEVISASLWPLLCLLSQTTTNLLTSCSWLTATGSADCRSASKWHKQRNNKESVWWKYQDRTSPLQKWCPYFCFGCRYYSIFVWSCIVLFFFPQWDKNGACVRHSNWTRSSCSFCVIVISQLC